MYLMYEFKIYVPSALVRRRTGPKLGNRGTMYISSKTVESLVKHKSIRNVDKYLQSIL